MKKSIIILVGACLMFSSCSGLLSKAVQKVTSGMEVPVNSTTQPSISTVIGDKNKSLLKDGDNNYVLPANGGKLSGKVPPASTDPINIPGEVNFDKSMLPEIMKNSTGNSYSVPCCLHFENSSKGSSFDFEANISDGKNTVHVGPITVPPGDSEVNLANEKNMKEFCNPKDSKEVTVNGMTIKAKKQTKAVPMDTEDAVVTVSGYVAMMFDPGYEFTYSFDLDDIDFPNLSKILSDAGLDTEAFSLTGDLTSGVPFDFTVTAECTLANGKKGTAKVTPTIAAGTKEKPVKTDFTIKVDLPGEMSDIQKTTVTVKGVVPTSKFSSPVTLNADQAFVLHIEKFKIDKGIKINF